MFFAFIVQSVPTMQQQQELMNEAIEKAKRAAELQAKIQAQLANKPNLVRTILIRCVSWFNIVLYINNNIDWILYVLWLVKENILISEFRE